MRLQLADNPERLAIALETTIATHGVMQRYFATMTKRRMSKIMCKTDRFDQGRRWENSFMFLEQSFLFQ